MFPFCKKEKKPSQVKCETCKHWVDKEDCQEKIRRTANTPNNWATIEKKIFFCPLHKVNWDVADHWSEGGAVWDSHPKFFKTIPAHEVEVDEKGKPIAQ